MGKARFLLWATVIVVLTSVPVSAQRGGRGGRGGPPADADRGAAVPQAMQNLANSLAELINNQDAEGLLAIASPNLVFLDEDGHQMPLDI